MLNKVILVGYVGNDAEIRVLESGAKYATFRLATSERYVRSDGSSGQHTEWHSIAAWRSVAATAEELAVRGAELYVEGSIRSRTSVNPKNKQEQTHYEIVATTLRPADDSGTRDATHQTKSTNQMEPIAPQEADPDGLPF